MTVKWVNTNVYVKVIPKVMILRLFHSEVQGVQGFSLFISFKWEYIFVETLVC